MKRKNFDGNLCADFKEPFVEFTKKMKREYTLLVPTMVPLQFDIIGKMYARYGYKMVLLPNDNLKEVLDLGLPFVNNDICYPAMLVVGQILRALNSGKYDVRKTAVIMAQTGGGCRASNYIHLIRKALRHSDYGFVPVVSFSVVGIEKHSGFKMNLDKVVRMGYGALYGDLISILKNQCIPYELNKGQTQQMVDKWDDIAALHLKAPVLSNKKIKNDYKNIVADFATIPLNKVLKPKVGIVGEIYVKFSPLANNNLEQFLLDEGCEVVVPGLMDFCLYTALCSTMDSKMFNKNKLSGIVYSFVYRFLLKIQKQMLKSLEGSGFVAPKPFDAILPVAKSILNFGAKMGEGWLLVAELAEMAESGVNNMVCTQPFGCMPNHIFAKGMLKPIKNRYPTANIASVDYDSGASRVNQENRIKLMLATAFERLQGEK